MSSLSWVEVSTSALQHNALLLKSLAPSALLNINLKANAYGHGMVECANVFSQSGADWFSVHDVHDAVTLRENGISLPILVIGYTDPQNLGMLVKHNLSAIVYDIATAQTLESIAHKIKGKAKLHLKIETGNHRMGLLRDAALELAMYVHSSQFLHLEGVYSHLANIEDTSDHSYTTVQHKRFIDFLNLLKKNNISFHYAHIANSAATLLYPDLHFDMVRPGVAAYGIWPDASIREQIKSRGDTFSLKPAFTWKTKIAQIRKIPKDSAVGYGCTYVTERNITMAVIPLGYYEGFDRRNSNRAQVLVKGKRAPVIGRVCMNNFMIDVSGIPGIKQGDEVVLIGSQNGKSIFIEEYADWSGQIVYEPTTCIPDWVPRRMVH